jgi:cytochrome c-type biogenesis protein CcmH
MLIWILFAVMTAAVVAVMIRPFARGPLDEAGPEAADLAVYRDQLNEIDADRNRGLIADAEADAARAEVARRLMQRAGKASSKNDEAAPASTPGWALPVTAITVPLAAIALYVGLGSPSLPNQPLAQRVTPDTNAASVMELVARVEKQLRDHPEDGRGWDVIAPIYLRLERYGDAAQSFGNAIGFLRAAAL